MKDRIVIFDAEGEAWTYERGGSRITGPDEINIWDHAAGAPGIPFLPTAVRQRVRRWRIEESEADAEGAGCDLCDEMEDPPAEGEVTPVSPVERRVREGGAR